MSNDASTAEQVDAPKLSAEDVVEYLRQNPDFFISQEELLADLSLPHESGKAVSLLERQVKILRDRGIEARQKLNNLLENARNNDQLFDTTRNLVLALLRARDVTELANVTQDQLSNHANIDACEIIFVKNEGSKLSNSVRAESYDNLKQNFNDVFRLKRTHCGELTDKQLKYLFPTNSDSINSTALCPATCNSEVLALLAFGNQSEGYFNINLDTLFLDFIGQVVGAVLDKEFAKPAQSSSDGNSE
jgi:hypothetical protein